MSQVGNKASLVCTAVNDVDAIHPLQISWYKGNHLIEQNGIHIIPQNNTLILFFDPVNRTDDGIYTCRASNRNDSFSEAKTKLTVQCTVLSHAILTSHLS